MDTMLVEVIMKRQDIPFRNAYRAHGPSWSPDGAKLAIVADNSGLDQAWLLSLDGKDPLQLTRFEDRVGLVSWSPVSDELLVTHDTGGDEHDQLFLLSTTSGEIRTLTQNSAVIHRFGCWSPDGKSICYSSNQLQPAFFDVWIMELASGTTRCVLQQQTALHPLAWSPDGSCLIVSRTDRSLDNNLLVVPIDGSTPTLLTHHDDEAAYASPTFSPDGRTLYVLTNHGRDFFAPAILDLSTLPGSEVTHAPISYLVETSWDADTDAHLSLSPDASILVYALNEDGKSRLVFYHIETGKELPGVALPTGVVGGITWAPGAQDVQGTQIAFDFNGPKHCGNVWVSSTNVARPVTTITPDAFTDAELVEPELVHYETFDGRQIPAFYYRPVSNARESSAGLATIVFVHGGPEGQFRPMYSAPWMPPIQYYLQRGFAVFVPNVRGSTGYGKVYNHLDDVRLRMDSVADLKAAAQWLTQHGGADPQRIGILGRSYGGFMVLSAVTTYPELWAAAVDIVGIANFVTFLENTGLWRRKLRESEYGSLEHDRAFLEQISPIHAVDRITAPLLVVHGANDPRVPANEAEQIVAALTQRQVPVKYLKFEGEGHYMQHQATQLAVYPAIGDWFDIYLA